MKKTQKKVYFAFGIVNLSFHEKDYRITIQEIKSAGNVLTRDDIDEDLKHMQNGKLPPIRAKKYGAIINSISDADLCIFDISSKSLAIGQQIEIALQKKKPVLIVSNLNKSTSIERLFISGSSSSSLILKNYSNDSELKETVANFFDHDFTKKKVRMNFFLEEELHDRIEKYSKETGQTKTDVIKKSLQSLGEQDRI